MQKRNKHILLSLTADQYDAIAFIADKQRRKIADAAYLILLESLNDILLKEITIHDAGLSQAVLNDQDKK